MLHRRQKLMKKQDKEDNTNETAVVIRFPIDPYFSFCPFLPKLISEEVLYHVYAADASGDSQR